MKTKKNIIYKNCLLIFILIILTFLFLFKFTFADSNGIWVYAKDIRGGVFGGDELVSFYNFINPVKFIEPINVSIIYSLNSKNYYINLSGNSNLNQINSNNVSSNFFNVYNYLYMHNKKIINLGSPYNPGDVVNLITLDNKVNSIQNKINYVSNLVNNLNNRVSSLFSSANSVQYQINNVNNKASSNSNAISNLNSKVSSNTNSINSLNSKVNSNTNSINSLNSKVSSNTNSINSLNSKISNDMNNLQSQTNNLNNRLSNSVNNLQYQINNLNNRVNSNTNSINSLKSQISSLQNRINYVRGCCNSAGESTPFLFTLTKNGYLIENDVMSTTFNRYYKVAKNIYENDLFNLETRPTNNYILRLRPKIKNNKIHLQLRELEPEESFIDNVKLYRIITNKNAELIKDYNNSKLYAVTKKLFNNKILSCKFDNDINCKKDLEKIDNLNIKGKKGDYIILNFNTSNFKNKKIFLVINSWDISVLPNQLKPFKGYSCNSLKVEIFVNNKRIQYKDIHPTGRDLETLSYLDISNLFRNKNLKNITIKITWTQNHTLDYVGLMEVDKSYNFTKTELPLVKAVEDNKFNVLLNLSFKDNLYAHTKRGDIINLTFKTEPILLENNEKVYYVFQSSGFYNGLRTYLYPNVDPSRKTFKEELKKYVNQLKKYYN